MKQLDAPLHEDHVRLGERHFIVKSDNDGPRIIYERRKYNLGHPYLEGFYNKPIWHRNHDRGHGPKSVPGKVIAELAKGTQV